MWLGIRFFCCSPRSKYDRQPRLFAWAQLVPGDPGGCSHGTRVKGAGSTHIFQSSFPKGRSRFPGTQLQVYYYYRSHVSLLSPQKWEAGQLAHQTCLYVPIHEEAQSNNAILIYGNGSQHWLTWDLTDFTGLGEC